MVSRSQDHQGETYAERHRAEELQTVGGVEIFMGSDRLDS